MKWLTVSITISDGRSDLTKQMMVRDDLLVRASRLTDSHQNATMQDVRRLFTTMYKEFMKGGESDSHRDANANNSGRFGDQDRSAKDALPKHPHLRGLRGGKDDSSG